MKEYLKPFICHVEDEPMIWGTTFGTRREAIESVRALVAERMHKNGAGWGAVLDDGSGELIFFVQGGEFGAGVPLLASDEMPWLASDEAKDVVDHVKASM